MNDGASDSKIEFERSCKGRYEKEEERVGFEDDDQSFTRETGRSNGSLGVTCEGEIRERREGDRVFVWCTRCEREKWE